MADDSLLVRGRLAFAIGRALPKIRYWAEFAWCEDEPQDLGTIQRLNSEVAEAVALLNEFSQQSGSEALEDLCRTLKTALEVGNSHFIEAWEGERRQSLLRQLPPSIDSADEYDRDVFLLKHSPLYDQPVKTVEEAAGRLIAALPAPEKACLEIACLLESEFHPTISGDNQRGQSGRSPLHELAYYRVTFNRRLRPFMQEVMSSFPFLAGLEHDLSEESLAGARKRISALLVEIDQGLRDPMTVKAIGYLGVVLDEPRRRVLRSGRHVDLKGKLEWAVFKRLVKSKDIYATRGELERCWTEIHRASPTPETLDQKISDIRKKVKNLGLAIANVRDAGWRLENSADDSAGS